MPVGPAGAVTVVGGGVAGVSTVAALRRLGHTGRLVLLDAGAVLHDRPPLSKAYLAGTAAEGELGLHPPEWFTEHDVDVRQGVRAVALDPAVAVVGLSDGTTVTADAVVLAQGASAHRPPFAGVELATVLRTLDDARGLRERLRPGARLVVVGAGLVGAEVAATAVALGVTVTLVDPDPVPLAAVVGPEVARLLHADHARHGVEVVQDTVTALEGDDVDGLVVRLVGGARLAADAVLVATGMVPVDDLARSSGLLRADGGGVVVDDRQRTSAPAVLAVGDGTRRRHGGVTAPPGGHWDAARLDGETAAAVLLGLPAPDRGAPWFWTDRYDRHVEVVGDPTAGARTVVRGTPGQGPAAVLGWRDGLLTGAVSVDDPRTARAVRRLVDRQVTVDPDVLADPATDLRALLRG
ncbi:NAD(P)/FAD-dependent oxidoreductase [Aquipuribacter sp. MA13-6]|uniref:NAD(P)/FAD-dependent oxidoreductase n=1 Tax=unclassified Aquipuribacter TaxID=2635084 RepID=UPI003EEF9D73